MMFEFNFIEAFSTFLDKAKPEFDIAGLIAKDSRIYPFGTDTKVLSTIFEMLIRPYIYDFAELHNFQVFEPTQQNFYPDFTFMKDKNDNQKIAFDVKTTYRSYKKDGTWRANFTLGSYASFMRNNTKNIAFPYSSYGSHFIIGFIYTRPDYVDTKIYTPDQIDHIPPSYSDVKYFIQEKYKIAGDIPGSGNTENIGSIIANSIDEFAQGNGPFANLGEDVFEKYWTGYPRYRQKGGYRHLSEFLKVNSSDE